MKKYCKQNARKVSDILKGIATPMRLLIICHLLEGEQCVQDLHKILGSTIGNISQHLLFLKKRQFIAPRRQGNFIFYSISDPKIMHLIECLRKFYCPGL